MAPSDLVLVEVACGNRHRQQVVQVPVPRGASAADAVQRSGLLDAFAEMCEHGYEIAVAGRLVDAGYAVHGGERLDLVGPLRVDPKEARRRRVALRSRRAGGQ